MKKIFLLTATLIFSVIFTNLAAAANIKEHPRLAVMNFTNTVLEFSF